MEMGETTDCKISVYAMMFEAIIKKVKEYGDRHDTNDHIASPFSDCADLCINKLINYYQFLDNPIVYVATVLDPRLKLKVYLKSSHPEHYSREAKKSLYLEYEKYKNSYQS